MKTNNEKIKLLCAAIECKWCGPAMGAQNAYHYELTVPNLLSKDQMELILRMVGQMKQETPHLFVLEFFWEKEDT